MRMRAAVLHRPDEPVTVEDVELDPPKAGEVLVRVVAAGVCHSDVRYADGELGEGHWPMILGHEGAGVVEEVGAGVTHVEPGRPRGVLLRARLSRVPLLPRRQAEPLRGRGRARRQGDADGRDEPPAARRRHDPEARAADGVLRRADGRRRGRRSPHHARAAAVAGGAPRVRRGDRHGRGAERGRRRARRLASPCIGCGGVGLQVVAAARIAGADPIIAVDRVAAKLELAAAQGATHLVDASARREARQHDPPAHGRRRRLRVRGRSAGRRRCGRRGARSGRAARPSSSALPPWASRRACLRSSSSRTRRSAAPTTAPATPRRSCPGSRSSPSRASSTSPASSPTSTRSTASRPRSTGSAAARARVRSW